MGHVNGEEGVGHIHLSYLAIRHLESARMYSQVTLRELKAGKESQARIPYSKRKKQFSTKYLPVTAPFHSQFLTNVPQMMEEVP